MPRRPRFIGITGLDPAGVFQKIPEADLYHNQAREISKPKDRLEPKWIRKKRIIHLWLSTIPAQRLIRKTLLRRTYIVVEFSSV